LRQIEELVADHREGDDPDDPPDPEARTHVVRFELGAETYALLRQARMVLDDEHGTSLSQEAFVSALCNAVLDGTPTSEPTGRAKFQIAITTCRRCKQGWQEGAGAQIPIDSAAVERAGCDAQHIGPIDGNAPERAHQDIPSSVMRFVWRRDGGRCRADGCRSARGLEVHHIVHREHGGSHDALNCILLCSACHLSHHRGLLPISGTADHLIVRRSAGLGPALPSRSAKTEPTIEPAPANASPALDSAAEPRPNDRPQADALVGAHVGATKLDMAILQTHAKAALTGLGWKPAIARVAVAAALEECGDDIPLERLIFESLRRCPVAKG
ncbi:MAG TPA: HNH endonuclease signature motif containing protein, partial [Usitatibacter sp.]|nr:HNH endonuclease signature motif containing protein [Usitatibacter sp.]